MEAVDLLSLVEHLEDNIDDLEENLEPLLSTALSLTTKKLPVLDNAKLYVLIVYSVESILFCMLASRFRLRVVTDKRCFSLSTTKRRPRKGACCLQRVNSSEAIL